MSQAIPDLVNQLSSSLRTNLNLSLKALNSLNSGLTEPTYSYANMLWYDTANNILKMKPEDNAAGQWINIGYLDQGTDTFKILDDTIVATTAGATTGLLGDQTTGTWETGTGTTESLVSPAKVRAASVSAVESLGEIKAYCNFNGANGTIRKSKNIASVTRNSEGTYTIVFTTAMPDVDYIITMGVGNDTLNHLTQTVSLKYLSTPTASGFQLSTGSTGGGGSIGQLNDAPQVYFSVIA